MSESPDFAERRSILFCASASNLELSRIVKPMRSPSLAPFGKAAAGNSIISPPTSRWAMSSSILSIIMFIISPCLGWAAVLFAVVLQWYDIFSCMNFNCWGFSICGYRDDLRFLLFWWLLFFCL